MAFEIPTGSGITGTGRVASNVDGSAYGPMGTLSDPGANNVAGYGTSPTTGTSLLSPAIQTIWSKEILFQAMPVLRFEQFAVKKTELGVMPGLTVNFMRYNNLPIPDGPLVEGIRMKTHGISAQQYKITVAEQGFAVAVSELLLNASFDDVMASASRLLGRNMALYMDGQARETITSANSTVYGYEKPSAIDTGYGIYEHGTQADAVTGGTNNLTDSGAAYYLTPAAVKDAVLQLSSKNIPRLGETYVCFIHPAQSRQLRDHPEFIEVTKYAAPGNFMLGEIGRLYDVVFIETTQITSVDTASDAKYIEAYHDGDSLDWRAATDLDGAADLAESPGTGNGTDVQSNALDRSTGDPSEPNAVPGSSATPAWDETWPTDPLPETYEAIMLGDNAFGHAISLPVELRDGGVLDFGREHALAWYSIWGFGLVTDSAVVKIRTN